MASIISARLLLRLEKLQAGSLVSEGKHDCTCRNICSCYTSAVPVTASQNHRRVLQGFQHICQIALASRKTAGKQSLM